MTHPVQSEPLSPSPSPQQRMSGHTHSLRPRRRTHPGFPWLRVPSRQGQLVDRECILRGCWLRAWPCQLCGSGHMAVPLWQPEETEERSAPPTEGLAGGSHLPLWLSITDRDPLPGPGCRSHRKGWRQGVSWGAHRPALRGRQAGSPWPTFVLVLQVWKPDFRSTFSRDPRIGWCWVGGGGGERIPKRYLVT